MPRTVYEMSRAEALRSFLARNGYAIAETSPPRPQWNELRDAALAGEVGAVYRKLGGAHSTPPVHPGTWDIATGTLAIELDEERHFNRYRALTLDSPLYSKLALPAAVYREFCALYESECIAAAGTGGFWTTPSSEFAFGASDPPRTFDNHGPARWRQRAFNDFVKDLAPLCTGLTVCRLAIWDDVSSGGIHQPLGAVLRLFATPPGRALEKHWGGAILDLIQKRSRG